MTDQHGGLEDQNQARRAQIATKYNVYILPENKKVEANQGDTILDASLNAEIPHTHACGGNAKCTTCRITVLENADHLQSPSVKESRVLKKFGLEGQFRLACQARIHGDVKIKREVLDVLDMKLFTPKSRELFKSIQPLGEERKAAILFADIQDYTPFTDHFAPYDIMHLLNRYFYLAGNVIKKYEGRIIDYYGDGFLAAFYLDETKVSMQAVKSAFALFAMVDSLNDYLKNLFHQNMSIRVGIHTEDVILGAIGIQGMDKLAVIGDTVNVASRIEQMNKETKTNLLLSETTYHEVAAKVTVGRTFQKRLKGKNGLYQLYEVKAVKDTEG